MENINKKFSIILLNYNEKEKNIIKALESIVDQSYKNIEIIIADDCSKNFNKIKIEKYLKLKRVDYKIIENSSNIGTVKNICNAINQSKGDYISFFASDDILAPNILEKYVKTLKNSYFDMVVSQWLMCDDKLNFPHKFIPKYKMFIYNMKKKTLKKDILITNKIGIGAVAFKKEIFNKYEFDERFFLLEDWPLVINIIYGNSNIKFINTNGLYHRASGVSNNNTISENKKIFMKEILDTYMIYCTNLMKQFNPIYQIKYLKTYKYVIDMYSPHVDTKIYYQNFENNIKYRKIIRLLWCIDRLLPHVYNKIEILFKYSKVVIFSSVISIISLFLIANIFNISKHTYIFAFVFIYLLYYIIFSIIKNIISLVKESVL